ncbi:hemicentin-1-like isoform X3 [Tenebrio molitor]|uniref:hemicentin-1-like isoform X3 n=1 Tax=Tenebrio molitor TaxID=7067 RepID=UPI0036248678
MMKIFFIFLLWFHLEAAASTKLTYYPPTVLKGATVTLKCEADSSDLNKVTYAWFKNNRKIDHVATPEWTIGSASVDTRSYFTCVTTHQNGATSRADVFVDVTAPPAFINRPSMYLGVPHDAEEIFLKCTIECHPRCSVIWFQNDRLIGPTNNLYHINNIYLPADPSRNDFESVDSTLHPLDKGTQTQYTCASVSQDQRNKDVKTTVLVAVEYPPENLTVSKSSIDVVENAIPEPVECSGKGGPRLFYTWKETQSGLVVARSSTLQLGQMSRFGVHNYTCEGSSKHGMQSVDVHFNVLYKPNCTVEMGEVSGQPTLICHADANPKQVTYIWHSITSEGGPKELLYEFSLNPYSYLLLNPAMKDLTTYQCQVNNLIGRSTPCEMTFPGAPFEMRLSGVSNFVVEGSTVLVQCQVLAKFKLDISWYNDTDLIPTGFENSDGVNNDGILTSSVLRFPATRWDNSRTFKCSATNDKLRKQHVAPLEKSLRLEVKSPPLVILRANKTAFTESEGESVALLCTYEANPPLLLNIVWEKNGRVLAVNPNKYTFDSADNLSLTLVDATREDTGEYKCKLRNMIGEGESQGVFIGVQHPPAVELVVISSNLEPFEDANITLTCKVVTPNPLQLRKVHWFVNDQPLEDWKDQLSNYKTVAGEDSSVLILTNIEDTFSDNFTCQGENDLGVGPVSESQEVTYSYPDIPTKLTYTPSEVVKGEEVTLECSLDNVDLPGNVSYHWYRNGYRFGAITTAKWTHRASLDTRKNITCVVTNGKRSSIPASVSIDVMAPPSFIKTPPPYRGVLKKSGNVTLTCRVECFPLCSIKWYENDNLLESDSTYTITNQIHPADFVRNYFESIESSLTLPAPDIDIDQLLRYTCASAATETYGPDVNYTVQVGIEFPPENLTVSKTFVTVDGDQRSENVNCSGDGWPRLSYVWKKASTDEIVSVDSILFLSNMTKSKEGNYTCEGFNKHGKKTANVYFKMRRYGPICTLEFGKLKNRPALICTVDADPAYVTFKWQTKTHDKQQTVDKIIVQDNLRSYLLLNPDMDSEETYSCAAYNVIGKEAACEITVPVAPGNLTLSKESVDVVEDEIPESVECSSEGFPVNYVWWRNSTDRMVTRNQTLQLGKMSRFHTGYYTCLAYNDAGDGFANVYFNVLYKPNCSVEYDSIRSALMCVAEANPPEATYVWTSESGDEIDEANVIITEEKSLLMLNDTMKEDLYNYKCVANNSIGISEPCTVLY